MAEYVGGTNSPPTVTQRGPFGPGAQFEVTGEMYPGLTIVVCITRGNRVNDSTSQFAFAASNSASVPPGLAQCRAHPASTTNIAAARNTRRMGSVPDLDHRVDGEGALALGHREDRVDVDRLQSRSGGR